LSIATKLPNLAKKVQKPKNKNQWQTLKWTSRLASSPWRQAGWPGVNFMKPFRKKFTDKTLFGQM
jgi:hypothetical protein